MGYELLGLIDWYQQEVWQICAGLSERYAISVVRVLSCLGDDVCKFPLNVGTRLLHYTVSDFRTR